MRPLSSSGTLYGTSQGGGSKSESCEKPRFDRIGGCGTVFSVTLSGSERIVYKFQGSSDGKKPNEGLIAGPNQTLYGTTAAGGGATSCGGGCGTVFAVTLSGSERILYSFQGDRDGQTPNGKLFADIHGALYGTTLRGGASACHCGTVFKLTPSSSVYNKATVYSFQGGGDGRDPRGDLVADRRGALYGTTAAGGDSTCRGGCGTVFKLTHWGTRYIESVIYRFQGGRDGAFPNPVIIARDGTLYGTTIGGGLAYCFGGSDCGTVFRLMRAGNGYTHTVLYTFKGHGTGGDPVGRLLADNGALYGTTTLDGAGVGPAPTAFKLTPSGTGYVFATIYKFESLGDGDHINGSLIADANGTLYGTAPDGGHTNECFFNIGCGRVFALTSSGQHYTDQSLYAFKQYRKDGRKPNGDLLLLR
jgi:uncharacterized repeat protein (TIGR03803 family)